MSKKKLGMLLCLACISLLGCHSEINTEVEVVTLAKTSQSWNGASLPDYLDGNPEITILQITIPPKTKLALHKHPEINAGVVLKGTLTVVSESGEQTQIHAGEPIVELVNAWHFGKNDGRVPVKLIVFYAGVKGTPITVLKE